MKLAIASCAKLQQINPQPVWSDIRNDNPDSLLLLGDNVYLDHNHHTDHQKLEAELDEVYQAQLGEQHFSNLLAHVKAKHGLFAIYDDHDFLGDNRYGGDHDPALREAARQKLIHYMSPPQTGSDVYSMTRLGPVDLFVLDERFYRRRPLDSYLDRDAILGPEQWEWFENQFRGSHADFRIIASSTTYHTYGNESWEQYPTAFERLRALFNENRQGSLFVSGDVHRNAAYDDSGVMEVVCSGVARKGLVFGGARRNYALLTFEQTGVRVELKSLKTGWRFDFRIDLQNWTLP